jgi:hypothetical protein
MPLDATLLAEHLKPAAGALHDPIIGTAGTDKLAATDGTFFLAPGAGADTITVGKDIGRGTVIGWEKGDTIALSGLDASALKIGDHDAYGATGTLLVTPNGGHVFFEGTPGLTLADLGISAAAAPVSPAPVAPVMPAAVTPTKAAPVSPVSPAKVAPVGATTPDPTTPTKAAAVPTNPSAADFYPEGHVSAKPYQQGEAQGLVGVYVGNEPDRYAQHVEMFGKPDLVLGYTGGDSWGAIKSVEWVQEMFPGQPIGWSLPLIPEDGTQLADAHGGSFKQHYLEAAQRMLAVAVPAADGKIHVRTGWELNGDWFQWAAEGKELDFGMAFQHFADAFHSVSDKFEVEWNANSDINHKWDPELAFPGAEYVDVIGLDVYWNPKWTSPDPTEAFNMLRDQGWGMQWIEQLGDKYQKPTAYSEWGVPDGDPGSATFIKLFADWVAQHEVAQQTVWDHWSAFDGELSDTNDAAAQAYKAAFADASPIA